MSYRLKSYLCGNCMEGKLIWQRKSKNTFGENLRFYKCDFCDEEHVDIEIEFTATLNVEPGGILRNTETGEIHQAMTFSNFINQKNIKS